MLLGDAESTEGYLLKAYTDDGEFAGDSWHEELDWALDEARRAFGISRRHWRDVPSEVLSTYAWMFPKRTLEGLLVETRCALRDAKQSQRARALTPIIEEGLDISTDDRPTRRELDLRTWAFLFGGADSLDHLVRHLLLRRVVRLLASLGDGRTRDENQEAKAAMRLAVLSEALKKHLTESWSDGINV